MNIGICGIGFMGMIHYLAAGRVPGARVAALCSRDERKLRGDWTGIKGNFGPAGTQMDLSGVKAYAEFEEMLADPGVDLIDLCVPSDDHRRLAELALAAGKHVLVEKPIALTAADADAMLAAAAKAGRRLMVAHVLPFFPEFAYAADAVRSGRYGRLLAAHFNRVIARPDWSAGVADADRSGGPAVDLHIHDTHFVGLLCGPPAAVQSRGVVDRGAVVHLDTQYLYEGEGAPTVSASSGALSQKGRPFAHGFDLYLERAVLSFASVSAGGSVQVLPLTVAYEDGRVELPKLNGGDDPVDAFVDEIAAAVGSVDGGELAEALSGPLARQALVTCLAEVESVRSGRAVAVR